MSLLNAALRAVFDLLLRPFAGLPPIVPVTVVALVSGIFALLVYRWTSDQKAIAAVKRRLFGHLLEVRLFNDDLRAVLAAQLRLLRENVTYLRLNLVPLLWMIVPFMLLIAQLQFHYGYDGLEVGERTLLVVDLAPADPADPAAAGGEEAAPRPPIELEAPAGVAVETAGVWVPSLRQVLWRLRADEPGHHELVVRADGESFAKSLFVVAPEAGARWVRRSPTRRRAAILDQLLYPAEPSLPRGGPIERIDVRYPAASISFFGLFDVHWLIAFLVLSLAFAFALRNRFGVTL